MIKPYRHKHLRILPIYKDLFLIEGSNYYKLIKFDEDSINIYVGASCINKALTPKNTMIKEPSPIYGELVDRYLTMLDKWDENGTN